MIGFRYRVMEIGDRHVVLLPRLNSAQMRKAAANLESRGFKVSGARKIVAERKGEKIFLADDGVCWSETDPTDELAPILPEMLHVEKEPLPLETILGKYYDLEMNGKAALVRFKPRVESSHFWRVLREKSDCGLAPDERAVANFILGSAGGSTNLLTDFPLERSAVKRFGKFQYYSSFVPVGEAAATLQDCVIKGTRNSYLPKNGVLNLESFKMPSTIKKARLVLRLAEWCYLSSDYHETSN